jgi:hypothetical protein
VKIWDSSTGKELFSLNGLGSSISSLVFSPDGQRLAAGGSCNRVKIWDSSTGKELSVFSYSVLVTGLAFSPNGQRLALVSDDHTLTICDSMTGKELLSLKGHANGVRSVAFSPDGQRLASGSMDQAVKIWDSVTGKELLSIKGHADSVTSVAFSPDGKRLASGSQDGSIHLWETSVPPEVQERRTVNQIVADLFRHMGLRGDVLERLRTVPGMSQPRRQEALAVAQTYPENPSVLNDLAWELVKLPGREMLGYRKALGYSEEACQLDPKVGDYLNTLGVAHYRVSNYDKALETLQRSDEINQKQYNGSVPVDLAFLAMTQKRLGHEHKAQAELQRLRERMKDPLWAKNAEAQDFLREAEALLAKPTTPGGK